MKILGRALPMTVPALTQRLPWIGRDLQTIRSSLFPEMPLPADQRLLAPIGEAQEQGFLSISVNHAITKAGADSNKKAPPLVILFHGLGGSEGSGYMIRSARHFNSLGWTTARVNFRGSGPSAPTSSPPYHAGLVSDMVSVIQTVAAANPTADIALMGFSLGGHLVLKTLASAASDLPKQVKTGVSVSAPLSLKNASELMDLPRNKFYMSHLVKQLKRDLRKYPMLIDPEILNAITRIREIDDLILAPKFGFEGSIDYYKQASVLGDLHSITHPTLAIHAADDPWIPVADCETISLRPDSPLSVLISKKGGHLGFFGKKLKINWFIPVAERYIIAAMNAE